MEEGHAVLLTSGREDPVGDGGKGVLAVKRQLDAVGLQRVLLHLLPGARHIVLCEEQSGAARQALDSICKWLAEG